MAPKMLRTFEKLEQNRHEVINLIRDIENHRYFKSDNGKWSIAQILIHIVTSEGLAVAYMKKKSLAIADLEDSDWKESVKIAVLIISQRLPIKFRAPKSIRERTPEPPSLQDLIARWQEVRSELEGLLNSIRPGHTKKLVFKHPIAGMFNAAQGIVFLREHLLHHLPQIKRHLK